MGETMPTDQELNAKVAAWFGAVENNANDWVHEDFGCIARDGFTSEPRMLAAILDKLEAEGHHWNAGTMTGGRTHFIIDGKYPGIGASRNKALCLAVVQAMAGEGVEDGV